MFPNSKYQSLSGSGGSENASESSNAADNIMEKVTALGERLKITGTEVSRKVSAGMSSMSFKMRELFQGQHPAERIVEEATAEGMDGPDWSANLEICDMMNSENGSSVEFIRGIKKRIMVKHPMVQYLALVLLETCVKNCEKAFSEVAAERVLDEMVRLIDDPQTVVNNRNKALTMIEAWGESGDELRYLPVYEETYKSLKSRGIRFPGRDDESLAPIFTPPRSVAETAAAAQSHTGSGSDFPPPQIYGEAPPPPPESRGFTKDEIKETFDVARNSVELLATVLSSSPTQDALQDDLTATLVYQCRQSQFTVQRIIETSETDESVLFEALNINDELQKSLSKYDELKRPEEGIIHREPEPPMIPVAAEPEESPRATNEELLVRKPAGVRGRSAGDEDIMDDLDEMIFGKKSGGMSGEGTDGADGKKKKKPDDDDDDDLIRF